MKAKKTHLFAGFILSFLLLPSTASTWRQMNFDASRTCFPAKKHCARNGGFNPFGNLCSPGLGPKTSDFLFYKQQLSTRSCFVKLKYCGINWCFTCCGDDFVDDSLGEASVCELCVVQFLKDVTNGCSIVVVKHTNYDVFWSSWICNV